MAGLRAAALSCWELTARSLQLDRVNRPAAAPAVHERAGALRPVPSTRGAAAQRGQMRGTPAPEGGAIHQCTGGAWCSQRSRPLLPPESGIWQELASVGQPQGPAGTLLSALVVGRQFPPQRSAAPVPALTVFSHPSSGHQSSMPASAAGPAAGSTPASSGTAAEEHRRTVVAQTCTKLLQAAGHDRRFRPPRPHRRRACRRLAAPPPLRRPPPP